MQRSNRSERKSTTSFTIGACISGGNNRLLTFIWMPTEWGFWGSWLDKWYGDVKVQTNFYLLAWKHRSPCKWCTSKSNRRLYWSMVSRPPYLCFYLNWDLSLLLLLLYFDTLRLSDSYQGQKSWCILSSIWCTNIFIGPVEPFSELSLVGSSEVKPTTNIMEADSLYHVGMWFRMIMTTVLMTMV